MTSSIFEPDQAHKHEKLGVTRRVDTREEQVASPTLSLDARRQMESDALDTAQRAIWPAVLDGDHSAINLFLKIHDRRVKLWGLTHSAVPQEWVVRVERG